MRKIVIFALALFTIGIIGTLITIPKTNTIEAIGLFQGGKQTVSHESQKDKPLDPEEQLEQAVQSFEESILNRTSDMVSGILDSTSDVVSDALSDTSIDSNTSENSYKKTKVNQSDRKNAKGIDSINIGTVSSNVQIKVTDSSQITASLTGEVSDILADYFTLKLDTKGKTLNINVDTKKIPAVATPHIYTNLTLTVQIPTKKWDQFSITSTNGNILTEQLTSNKAYFKASNGNVVNRNLTIHDQYKVEITNGNLDASDIKSQKSVEVKTINGNIVLERAQGATLNLNTIVGKIKGKSLLGELFTNSTTGNIEIDQHDISLAGAIQATTTTGGIDIILRPKESVSLQFESSLGNGKVDIEGMTLSESSKLKLVGKAGDGKYKIQATTTTGNFTLSE